MFNTVTPDRAMSEGSPRMMIIIFLVLSYIATVYIIILSYTSQVVLTDTHAVMFTFTVLHLTDHKVLHNSEL